MQKLKLHESKTNKHSVCNFSNLVPGALDEIGPRWDCKNGIMAQAEKHLRSGKPLRSGFVNDVLCKINDERSQVNHESARRSAAPDGAMSAHEIAFANDKTERKDAKGVSKISVSDANNVSMEIYNKASNLNKGEIKNELFPDDPRYVIRNEFNGAFKKAVDNAVKTVALHGEKQHGPGLVTKTNLQVDKEHELGKLYCDSAERDNERLKIASKAQERYAKAVREYNGAVENDNKQAEAGKMKDELKQWDHEREFSNVVEVCAKEFENQVALKFARAQVVELN